MPYPTNYSFKKLTKSLKDYPIGAVFQLDSGERVTLKRTGNGYAECWVHSHSDGSLSHWNFDGSKKYPEMWNDGWNIKGVL